VADSKRERASEKNRARIISSTIQLLVKKGGSASVSTTDICTAARLTRPTLYHYFGSKRNLLLSVHKKTMERDLKPYMGEALSIDNPLQRLDYMVRTYTKGICLHPELRILIHDTLARKDRYFREVREEWKQHYVVLRDTITRLKSEGVIDSGVKPSWGALFVLGMLTWVTYWFDFGRKDSIDQIAESAVQFVRNGLGVKDKRSSGAG
jgi:AcrR family transcriptional regulator